MLAEAMNEGWLDQQERFQHKSGMGTAKSCFRNPAMPGLPRGAGPFHKFLIYMISPHDFPCMIVYMVVNST